MSLGTMIITSEKAIQKSMTCPLAKTVCEPFMETVSFLVDHQDATRRACGAACFMRVLSHLI
jgi:hypothetical protein